MSDEQLFTREGVYARQLNQDGVVVLLADDDESSETLMALCWEVMESMCELFGDYPLTEGLQTKWLTSRMLELRMVEIEVKYE